MTPSIRPIIRQLYPDFSEEDILACLTRCGRGLGHARSAILYKSMLECANGNMVELNRLVDWACRDDERFAVYIERFDGWNFEANCFARRMEYLQHFAPVLRRISREVSEYRCFTRNSHMTICLAHAPSTFPAALHLVPLCNRGVFISQDHRASFGPKTDAIIEWCEGELVTNDAAPARIMFHIAQTFPHDLIRPETR